MSAFKNESLKSDYISLLIVIKGRGRDLIVNHSEETTYDLWYEKNGQVFLKCNFNVYSILFDGLNI